MKIIYSSSSDLSNPEIQILELTKKNDAPSDVSNEIYKQLDPLECALVFLARNINRDLRRDRNGEEYQITQGSHMFQHEMGTSEWYDTFATIKRLKDDKITITAGTGSESKTKTYNLDEFINKTREIALATLNHQKIHQSVLEINPQLDAFISFCQHLKNFKYLDNDLTAFISYLNPDDGRGKTTLTSAQTILAIYPENKFKFKHIDEQLTFEELSKEIERMKKISELTKIAEDLSKNVFTDCKIRREPNPSNLLLPIVIITKDQDSYVINNDSVTIKISGNETVKSLEEFVSDLKKDIPLTSSEKPNFERVDGAVKLTK